MVSRRALTAVVLALSWTSKAGAADARRVELVVPPTPSAQQAATLAVEAGAIPRGTEIDIATPEGVPIGTVSPFAIRPNQPAGTYLFPLPAETIRDGRVVVLLSMRRAGVAARAPNAEEVPKVSVVFLRVRP